MLQVDGLGAGYGGPAVLEGIDLDLKAGEVLCLMGRNGAGKTTLLRALVGQIAHEGRILLEGQPLEGLPGHEVPRRGIAIVPQGRRLFGAMSVAENLEIGLMCRGQGRRQRAHVLELFPRLAERMHQPAATLSGGEQQMLAIARALCLEPKVLLLDEPSEGLQPSMVALIRDVVLRLRGEGVAILLVEHRVETVLQLADQILFLVQGRLAHRHRGPGLTAQSAEFVRYLGV